MSLKVILLAVVAAFLSLIALADVVEEINQRTAPVGGVCMAGESCAAPAVAVVSGPRSGDEIYNASCMSCHNAGVAGAPILGDAVAWQARLDDKGIDTIYTNAINGIGAMPAMGLCTTCSDDDIKTAIDYMIAESQ